MSYRDGKMGSRSVWRLSVMLIWLLTAEAVYSLPKATPEPTKSTPSTAFKTQYPPLGKGARVAPQTQGVYHTTLGRDPRRSQLPFPTVPDPVFNASSIPELSPHNVIEGPADFPSICPLNVDIPPVVPLTPRPPVSNLRTRYRNSSLAVAAKTSSSVVRVPATPASSTTVKAKLPEMTGQDVFKPLATGGIPSNIKPRNDHPVSKSKIANTSSPIETNKFYAGLFLGEQNGPAFPQPYSVTWSKGTGNAKSWGMAVSHIEAHQLAFGPKNDKIPGSPVSYYINPLQIQSMVLSAAEFKNSTTLTVKDPLPFSAKAVLRPHAGAHQTMTVPVLQGMSFVTGEYSNLELLVQSSILFRKLVSAGSPRSGIFKYQVTLEDGTAWLVYATPSNGQDPKLKLESNTSLRGPSGFSGTVQVAKNPAGATGEKLFDNSAGVYAVDGAVAGSVDNTTGEYDMVWAKAGKDVMSTPLMMYALPHHVESFASSTKARVTSIQLRTTTKGMATAVTGELWTMTEPNLPIDMGFAPWSSSVGNIKHISNSAQQFISQVAPKELGENMEKQTNLNSMYYSGKALNKFAMLTWTVAKLGGNDGLAKAGLAELKTCFARFVNNQQQFPLVYDTVWKGAVSVAGYGGDVNTDFGNTLYNDHHFHYGYFILAAAIIGDLDPDWLACNKDWVNMLVRDAGNPSGIDPHFPFSRMFDWYHGHSWAKGLFVSFDGKDEESTSEDAMFAYAIKMWGRTTGDASMEARGNLMLGIMRHTLHDYFLMEKTNKNQPQNFIANRVTGILFENKVDHTTYFGNNLEYIEGIHMLPLLPSTPFTRMDTFVQEEWTEYFAPNATRPASKVDGGWKGVLYGNLAQINAKKSWEFFSQNNFDYSWVDGGASRTWYLAMSAALGGD